jgi:F-type H+-transporting ATPase subunit b
MDSLIETFHIDIKLLIAQMINFAIVISVLYFFALKPLMKVMKDRTVTIEKSLEDAKKIETNLEKTESDYKAELAKAKKDANEILEKTQEQSEKKREEMLKKAKDEIGRVITEEKEKIHQEKMKMLKEVKAEIADLVIATTEKVLEKKLDAKEDKELVSKVIKAQ